MKRDKAIFWIAPLISVTAAMLAHVGAADWAVVSDCRPERRAAVHPGHQRAGDFRNRAGRMGVEQPLFAAGRAAQRGATGELRNRRREWRLSARCCWPERFPRARLLQAQDDYGVWFIFAAPVGFFIYLVASIAETNRAPFDLPEAESELVAGYMTEYSGFRWALYFLAEYTNMVVVASIATTLFLGGWLRPFAGTPAFNFLDYLPPLLMLGVGGYCFYRAPKQPVEVQKMFMVAVGLLVRGLAADSGGAAAGAGGQHAGRGRSRDCTARSGFC